MSAFEVSGNSGRGKRTPNNVQQTIMTVLSAPRLLGLRNPRSAKTMGNVESASASKGSRAERDERRVTLSDAPHCAPVPTAMQSHMR